MTRRHEQLAAPPHVLLVPYPSQGHITPLMELGRKLSALGVTVTLVTFHRFVERIQKARAAAAAAMVDGQMNGHAAGHGEGHVRLAGVPDGLPPDADSAALHTAIGTRMEGEIVHLVEALACPSSSSSSNDIDGHGESDDVPPITCLVGDFFLSWMPRLAQRVNLPEVVFWPQTASAYAMFTLVDLIVSRHGFNPCQNYDCNGIPVINSYGPRDETVGLITCLPGVPPVHPADLPFQHPIGKGAAEWIKRVIDTRLASMDGALALLANSFEELEPHHHHVSEATVAHGTGQLSLVGPLIPSFPDPLIHQNNNDNNSQRSTGTDDHADHRAIRPDNSSLLEEDQDCIKWLDAQPPSSVVYVSFGSLSRYSSEQLHQVALGLAASQQKFLWVIRQDSLLEEVDPIDNTLPQGFLDEIQRRGKIIRWAPQSRVLAHPSIGGFFSHCGWNSVLEGLCHGVPILGWPYMNDQFSNCWLVCQVWKTGLKLVVDEKNRAEKEEVERAVKLLMSAGEDVKNMRARAKALRDSARKAITEDGGTSHRHLQHFVEECLMSRHYQNARRLYL